MEIERSDLNSLKVRDLSLVVYYENRRDESVRLFEVCEENLLRNDVVGGTTNFIKLKENNKHLIGLTENQKDIDKDLFILAERLLSNSENQEVLRNYRDWISYFNKLLKTKLDANTWFQAQGAVYRNNIEFHAIHLNLKHRHETNLIHFLMKCKSSRIHYNSSSVLLISWNLKIIPFYQ
ncbi:hypothetical protein RclHR1_12130004 [Rhizophagus clarus]|uniref:Uncharacterized protein n=1 Tax=Rhizophagus clarus TaxID=94130 RepID=A0A2Z6Q6A7_9GLOM|nr:hypothetical protein RclHR1_12130004 [Rhizophagus clarus]